MNFKLTWLKGIVSIIGGIIIGYLGIYIRNYYTYLGKPVGYAASMTPGTRLFFYIAPIILIYVVWSLFQKGGNKK